MAAFHIPTTRQDITAEWLTDVLRRSKVITKAAVEDVDTQVIGVGLGFTSLLWRLAVRYDSLVGQGPSSIITKLPALDEPTSQSATATGLYERELRFYEQLAPHIPLPVPRCYFSAMDSETGNFILLLEDLTTTATSRQIPEDACSIEEADFVVRQLAMLHAAWWEDSKLDEFPWIPRFNSRLQQSQDAYARLWPVFLERWGAFIPKSTHSMVEFLGEHVPFVKDYLARSPQTLLHGDFRLDNMFFSEGLEHPAMAVLDWQGYCRGLGAYDVAYFIGEVVDAGHHATYGLRLIKSYHDALAENGVQGYGFEQCLVDYRMAHLERSAFIVRACASLDFSSVRERQLAERGVRNMAAALIELDAVSLLPV